MLERNIFLIDEKFFDFDIGEFPFDREHSAMGEYHVFPPKGNCGIWYDPVANYNYRGPSWIVTENNGKHFMEQMRVETDKPHQTFPMLIAGDTNWFDYTATTTLRLLHTSSQAGIGICCQNCLNLIAVVFENQQLCVVYRHKESQTVLASADFSYNSDDFYTLTAEISGDLLVCYVNSKEILRVNSNIVAQGGKIALTATMPTQFQDVSVVVSKETLNEIQSKKDKCSLLQQQRSKNYPKMRLWKKLDLQNFGCGRQIRFGHLLGNNELQIVFAQCQKRVHKDAYATISCLTAIDLSGKILWQRGAPMEKEEFGNLTADLPLQIYDIDGDGFDEVITAKDFEILILDGKTGEVKKRAKTPISVDDGSLIGVPFNKYAFSRLNPDGIRIANLSGNQHPSDIILKDRYCRLFALDKNLNLLWTFRSQKNTGHFPYTFDFNGDGRDEVLCGYNLISADGKLIWSLPVDVDHTDEIVAGKFLPNQKFCFGLASGTQGFILADINGNILARDGIGHAQRISVAKYKQDSSSFQFCVTNFWGHNSVVYLYNNEGTPLWELETQLNGNIIAPVDWVGDGKQLILLNGDTKKGGLLDGDGIKVVEFPDDGHPTLCAEAIDLFGDSRDELVVWDKFSMFIYTQADNPKNDVKKSFKTPHHHASNYRGEYAVPCLDTLKN